MREREGPLEIRYVTGIRVGWRDVVRVLSIDLRVGFAWRKGGTLAATNRLRSRAVEVGDTAIVYRLSTNKAGGKVFRPDVTGYSAVESAFASSVERSRTGLECRKSIVGASVRSVPRQEGHALRRHPEGRGKGKRRRGASYWMALFDARCFVLRSSKRVRDEVEGIQGRQGRLSLYDAR